MKFDIKVVVIIFFALLCVVLSSQVNKISDEIKNVEGAFLDYQSKYEHLKLISENKAILFKMQYYIEGDTLDDVELENLYTNKRMRLLDILTKNPSLFFYISEEGCESCYLPYLKRMNLLSQKYGADKVIVLAHFTDKRNLEYLFSNNQIDLNTYVLHTTLDLFPKYNFYPILFFLSKNRYIENAFVADKSNLDLIDSYLEVVEHRFLKIN
ncbi:uncharacterized protein BN477_00406 [Bacteroides stercoris CAG:120]|jgi:hypothetical protein|nr:uncharacterized protein BN477_00406 [Bacteroides stercoris CAG:120]